MKLHAGSLYMDYLVLYGHKDGLGNRVIKVPNHDLQWEIYCNEVDFELSDAGWANVTFNGTTHKFQYVMSHNPMKDLGFLR